MKILLQKKIDAELRTLMDVGLRNKIIRNLENFDQYFRGTLDFDTNKIEKIKHSKSNIYVLRIDANYRLIFTAEYNKDNELVVVFLEIAKHDDFERRIFKLLNE